jgi:4-aminobutyrate aminotransferase-like enzyme
MSERELGALLPEIVAPPPGPTSREMAARLRRVESRNITYVDDRWPVFWDDARGANVLDADGNIFIDLTSAFGVALLGHRSAPLEHALLHQRLIHGMGDIHPPVTKLELLERLTEVSPWDESRVVLANTGSEAVEIGLKTAALQSGRPGVLAFEGGYHGLTLGSLAVTKRVHFRDRFGPRLYEGVAFAPFPDAVRDDEPGGARSLRVVEELLDRGAPNGDAIGTIVVEPVQARGGARVPPDGYMAALSDLADAYDVAIVADEIFTGVGRCGAMFASERVGLRPDIVCIGKALGAGLPLSACIAPAEIMDAWPESTGEAVHTSTFLGHPLACAAALGVLEALADGSTYHAIDEVGALIRAGLDARLGGTAKVADIRGLGLLIGIELVAPGGRTASVGAGVRIAEQVLSDGVIALPAGDEGEVLEFTPPVVITSEQVDFALDRVAEAVEDVA